MNELLSVDDLDKVESKKLVFIRIWVISTVFYLLYKDAVNFYLKNKKFGSANEFPLIYASLALDITVVVLECINYIKKLNLTRLSLAIL